MADIDTTKILVATGLKGRVNYSILNNVIGQLSDGMWENSRVAEHYWPFVEIKMDDSDNVIIMVHKPGSNKSYFARPNTGCNNWFVNPMKNIRCNHSEIRKYFAKKLQALVADERRCYPIITSSSIQSVTLSRSTFLTLLIIIRVTKSPTFTTYIKP